MELQLLTGSLELQQSDSKQPATGDEREFLQAIQNKRINQQPENDLRKVLKYVMLKVGIRGKNFPQGAEKALLINHIYQHYGNHTLDEIRLAFDLAITGKLNLTTDEIKHYESFSCTYFSTIMNAFRVWAGQVYNQQVKPKAIEYKPDPEEIEREYQEFLKTPLAKKLNLKK